MSLALLTIQAEGSFDARGRIRDLYGVTIARAGDGQALWIGADIPDLLADELTSAFQRSPTLERCRSLLERDGCALPGRSGPSFLIEAGTHFSSPARLERSDGAGREALRGANPGNWQPVEWDELLDGRLGPWTMALEAERVVSICHTPGPLGPQAAECGVWTDPAFRGRGLAAAVTAEWAALLRPSGRHLFYSTDDDNLSSQRVAQRLGLRPVGWTCGLGRVRSRGDERVHPLSSLRSVR